jgi:predicted ATPase/DNA-binding SARP family transcriptional activator
MALLVYLAITGERYTRDALAALFWPNDDQIHARGALRRALSELSKLIGLKLTRTGVDTVSLAVSPDFWLDAGEFHRWWVDAQTHPHPPSQPCPECFSNLTEAARLYRADFLSGYTLSDSAGFDEWLRLETESLRLEMTGVLKQLVSLHQARHEADQAVLVARRWLGLDPTDESAHRFLMQLYAASGQRSAALRQYQECVHILGLELGVNPAEETTRLYELICSQAGGNDEPFVEADAQQHFTSSPRLNNLPAPLTAFIGRDREQTELIRLLKSESVRLVTITGAGGMGKTRLALQVANEVMPVFAQGVWLVDFNVLTDPALVEQVVANALGIRANLGAPYEELLAYHLRSRALLLVLDNCDRLVEACAHLAVSLLKACPDLSILATSREVLGVEGEVLYPLASLAFPELDPLPSAEVLKQYEAVQLFSERASQISPGFTVTQNNALAICKLCQRLDGLPLALELAAARANLLTIYQIVDRLDAHFWALTASPHASLPRHRSLQACMDWSYTLLSEPERILLRRLAVFVGGWTLEAAEAVCADLPEGGSLSGAPGSAAILDLLAQLVNKSLVSASLVVGFNTQREMRYRLLDTFHQYAFELLVNAGEEQSLRDRHLAFFTRFSEQAAPKLRGAKQPETLRKLEADRDNLRTAMFWALAEDEPEKEFPQDRVENGLRLGTALVQFWPMSSPFQGGLEWLSQGLKRIDNQEGRGKLLRARTLYSIATLHRSNEVGYKPIHARRAYEQSIELLRSGEDLPALSLALADLGWFNQSQSLIDESLAVCSLVEDPWYRALALLNKSMISGIEDDTALACVRESLALFREIGDIWNANWAMIVFGGLICKLGNYAAGLACIQDSARFFQEMGSTTGMIFSNHCWGLAAYDLEDFNQMAECIQRALEINRRLGKTGYSVHYLRWLGTASKRLGDYKQSAAYTLESLSAAQRDQDAACVLLALSGMAGIAAAMHQPIHAVHLLGAVEAMLEPLNQVKDRIAQFESDRDTAQARAQLDEAAYNAAWAEGRAMSLERAIQEAHTIQDEEDIP